MTARRSAAPTPVTPTVLGIVAEKTGYPSDMLELDLDLEADLGVDTVKQAETFAAVREASASRAMENLKLRDFPTLRHVVASCTASSRPREDVGTAARCVAADAWREPVDQQLGAPGGHGVPEAGRYGDPRRTDLVTTTVLAIVAEKTGYPSDMLELDLDLEADLGVDTVKQAETFAAVRAEFGIPRDENLKLRDFPTLRHVVRLRAPAPSGPGADCGAGRRGPYGSAKVAMRYGLERETGRGGQSIGSAARPHLPALGGHACRDADRVPRRVATPALRPAARSVQADGRPAGRRHAWW